MSSFFVTEKPTTNTAGHCFIEEDQEDDTDGGSETDQDKEDDGSAQKKTPEKKDENQQNEGTQGKFLMLRIVWFSIF